MIKVKDLRKGVNRLERLLLIHDDEFMLGTYASGKMDILKLYCFCEWSAYALLVDYAKSYVEVIKDE